MRESGWYRVRLNKVVGYEIAQYIRETNNWIVTNCEEAWDEDGVWEVDPKMVMNMRGELVYHGAEFNAQQEGRVVGTIKYLASIALAVIALYLGVYLVVSSTITAKCESYASKKETDYSVSMAVCYIKSGDKWLTLDEYSKAEIGYKIMVDRGEL